MCLCFSVLSKLEIELEQTVDEALEGHFKGLLSGDLRKGLKSLGKTDLCVCPCIKICFKLTIDFIISFTSTLYTEQAYVFGPADPKYESKLFTG